MEGRCGSRKLVEEGLVVVCKIKQTEFRNQPNSQQHKAKASWLGPRRLGLQMDIQAGRAR